MIKRLAYLWILPLLLMGAWDSPAADCGRGQACPEPGAATASAHSQDPKAAIAALLDAARTSTSKEEQVDIYAKLARLYLEQDQLAEAIAYVERAVNRAGKPTPAWLLDLSRRIDSHHGRTLLSAAQIDANLPGQAPAPGGMRARGMPSDTSNRGFPPEPPSKLDLYVLFDFDQDQPNAQGRRQVQELAKALRTRPSNQRFQLIGHTDARGTVDYNQRLSERRAESVLRLVETLAPELNGRLQAIGRGKSELKYPSDTEEDHRLNRRVQLDVVSAL